MSGVVDGGMPPPGGGHVLIEMGSPSFFGNRSRLSLHAVLQSLTAILFLRRSVTDLSLYCWPSIACFGGCGCANCRGLCVGAGDLYLVLNKGGWVVYDSGHDAGTASRAGAGHWESGNSRVRGGHQSDLDCLRVIRWSRERLTLLLSGCMLWLCKMRNRFAPTGGRMIRQVMSHKGHILHPCVGHFLWEAPHDGRRLYQVVQ